MSANKEDTLRQFCDVTGADEARSRFFLESSNWQLDVALSSFYEHGGSVDEAPIPTAAPLSAATLSDSDMESPPGSPQRPKKESKKPASSKFATLESLQQESSSDDDEAKTLPLLDTDNYSVTYKKQISKPASQSGWVTSKDLEHYCIENQPSTSKSSEYDVPSTSSPVKGILSDPKNKKKLTPEEEIKQLKEEISRLKHENIELKEEVERLKESLNGSGQAFYAGGSERSGQQIIGPGKNRKDIVTEMFKSVRERGAVVFEDEPSTASRGRGAFTGTGYRLGQTADDHEPVTQTGTQAQGEAVRAVRLRLYREGFSVDGGPVRSYTDPEHAEFLNCIRRGEIPQELAGAGEVRVSLEDRRHEPAPRAGPRAQAFAGKGQMLGSPTPAVVGAPAPAADGPGAPPARADPADPADPVAAAQAAVGLDDSQPITTIQFRLADGSRVAGRFNHSHTVRDLRAFVEAAAPAGPFALLVSYPPAELADPAASLADAGLLNSTLLQRLK